MTFSDEQLICLIFFSSNKREIVKRNFCVMSMKHLNSIKQCNVTGIGLALLLQQRKLLGKPLQDASVFSVLLL